MGTTSLINGLRVLLESEEKCGTAIRVLCKEIKRVGLEYELVEDDGEPEEFGDGIYVISEHHLVVGGEEVAQWTRCSRGQYGSSTIQGREDEWYSLESTDGGDILPKNVAIALYELDLDDDIPLVPEPKKAREKHQEDKNGEYAVYWDTVSDGAGVVARYSDLSAAQEVCEQHEREFRSRNPQNGGYLCGYEVRQLVNGEWTKIEQE